MKGKKNVSIFSPATVALKVGDVVRVDVVPPIGKKIKQFIRSNECVDGWPAELPPGLSFWTLNGLAAGAGTMTCVLDDGTNYILSYQVVSDVPPPIKDEGAFAVEVWSQGNRFQAVARLVQSVQNFDAEIKTPGKIILAGTTPDGVKFCAVGELK